MNDQQNSFPIGARVYVDGRYIARIRAHFPKGSSSYAWPHYKLDYAGGDRDVAVACKRVGVDAHRDLLASLQADVDRGSNAALALQALQVKP